MGWITERYDWLTRLFRHDIWEPAALRDRSLTGRAKAVLRVVSVTFSGLFENHITTRAAALTYASLLGLGPLVALAMLVAGFMLHKQDPTVVVKALDRAFNFIAPQVGQFDQLTSGAAGAGTAASASNSGIVSLIDSFITGSRSGAAGAVGALTLILIVIRLFASVENAFNAVWGVRRGRSWMVRVVIYWTIISLGAVLFFALLTALSATAFIDVFFNRFTYGRQLLSLLQWMLPVLSALLVVVTLTLFYRYIPNTRVFWSAALAGAIAVTALLFLNNYLAFVYCKRVVLQKSLYGSLGILPILMLGLYIFWFFVLVGGQISYAVQNVDTRSRQAAWRNLSEEARENLSLLVLLIVGRRFKDCLPPCSAAQLAAMLNVPTQVLNESLNRLGDLGLVVALPAADGDDPLDHRFQPARPLSHITLAGFKQLFSRHGENPDGGALDGLDPVLRLYRERLAARLPDALGTASLEALLEEFPAGQLPAAG